MVSCAESPSTAETDLKKIELTQERVNPFLTLEGAWTETIGQTTYTEEWKADGQILVGKGLAVSEGDTLMREEMRMEFRDSSWVYATVVEGHNEGREIVFTNILQEDSLYIFENRDHDYPSAIGYQLRRSGALQVKLRGTESGEIRTEEFNFRRKARL